MNLKNKKQTWREKILYYEVCPKGKVSGAFRKAYRWFLCSACVLAVLLFLIYVSLFFFAHRLLEESRSYKQVFNSEEWLLEENMWRAIVVDQDLENNTLYLQTSGLDAVLAVKYNEKSQIYSLEYQPALVDNGRVLHASRVHKVPAKVDRFIVGSFIYLKDLRDLDDGLYAPELLIGNYNELTIPNLGF